MDCKAFVILGNKIDLKEAVSRETLITALGVSEMVQGSQAQKKETEKETEEDSRRIGVFQCSLVDGVGYQDAFKWLSTKL